MRYFFNWLKRNIRPVALTLVCFAIFILFESFQQLFYIRNFNNGVPAAVGFWSVLQDGIYRWLIWLAVSIPMVLVLLRFPLKRLSRRSLMLHGGLVLAGLLLNLLIITVSQNSVRTDFWTNFSEVFEFYFFHKAPIILIALIFLALLVHYFRSQAVLEVTMMKVNELQSTNEHLYEELSKGQLEGESLVFEVKIGNRVKLLSENVIQWIAADDYCVRMYTEAGDCHMMRTSLKALEAKLPSDKFLRVHRKAIVNLARIKEYHLGTNPKVILDDDTEVSVAQSRLSVLKSQLVLT